MRKITFTTDGFKEYNRLLEEDFTLMPKIQLLIKGIQENPFKGLGKPEPLKGGFSGYWSRRITQEHRLVYRVTNEAVEIIKCYGHYND